MNLADKRDKLKNLLTEFDRVAVAFSGGVDSTFLLFIAGEVLGPDRVVALTADTPIFPAHELAESVALAGQIGIRQVIVPCAVLDQDKIAANPPERCYHCKLEIFSLFLSRARELGFQSLLDGSNLDDLDDYRPGRKALDELNIVSPLLEAGLTKEEIRQLSRQAGLATADKPSYACLATRFPYGTKLTVDRLRQVAHCENFLRQQGLRTFRVRCHDDIARIEVSLDEMPRMIEDGFRAALLAEFKAAGFRFVALDLEGYRTGSLNESLALVPD